MKSLTTACVASPAGGRGSVESGDQTCVTSINLGQKSPEQINKLQICVAWNASQCDVT